MKHIDTYLIIHALPELQLFRQRLAAVLQVNSHQRLSFKLSLSNSMAVLCLKSSTQENSQPRKKIKQQTGCRMSHSSHSRASFWSSGSRNDPVWITTVSLEYETTATVLSPPCSVCEAEQVCVSSGAGAAFGYDLYHCQLPKETPVCISTAVLICGHTP